MQVKTIQNREVAEALLKGKTHFSHGSDDFDLQNAYKIMKGYYGWNTIPVFACEVGRHSEFEGAHCKNAVLLTLDVPDKIAKRQRYYDWSDVIYFTQYPEEWDSGQVTMSLEDFVKKTLDGHLADNPDAVIQVALPYIRPEWLVRCEELTEGFIQKHVGGTSSILTDEAPKLWNDDERISR